MWSRAEIKAKAKTMLKGIYWQAFLVSFVIVFAGGSHGGGSISLGGGGSGGRDDSTSGYEQNVGSAEYNGIDNYDSTQYAETESDPEYAVRFLTFFLIILLVVVVITIIVMLLRIFIGYPLEVGGRKYYIKAAEGESRMGYLGDCFKGGKYGKILGAMLLRDVYTFLWFLLLFIPGLVKRYAYRMVPYILADNPEIGAKRAIELSNQMTKGQKFNIFVLDLSFIGWYILGTLALLIGVLFVKPYDDATNVQLYFALREDAIAQGLTTKAEMNIVEEIDYFEF